MATRIQFRRGNSSEWGTTNPTLAQGEPALEIDTNKFKVGDGVTAWNNLGYIGGTGGRSGTGAGWKDLLAPLSSAKGEGTSEPKWEDIGNGQFAYHFSEGESLFTVFHAPHDWTIGTLAYIHLHWFTDEDMSIHIGDVIEWGVKYTVTKGYVQGDSFTQPQNTITLAHTVQGGEVLGEHIITECNVAQAIDMKEIDSLIMCEVTLISEPKNFHTYALYMDLHYETDGMETVEKTVPFTKNTGA